jgi:hypothetical protein
VTVRGDAEVADGSRRRRVLRIGPDASSPRCPRKNRRPRKWKQDAASQSHG